ncbi:MAG: hypothetical protein M1830_009272 [Pleopsidium flavum]|nr:MAG: hypothetical protein M1830_009272 [Pleopsidium flavum]
MTSRIPPLLAPYTHLPPSSSLIVLTSVLGASTNWLVLRFLYNTLLGSASHSRGEGYEPGIHNGDGTGAGKDDESGDGETKVVLVSFLRDWEFWREGGRRVGLDFPRLMQQGRFAFVDGLTGLFTSSSASPVKKGAGQVPESGAGQEIKVLRSSKLERIERDVLEQIEGLKESGEGRVVLVLDQPDLVLAVVGEESGAGVVEMGEMVLGLREHVHSTLLTLSADLPLIQSPTTPLEINHAAFVVGLAHLARFTMSLRLLDTGAARDVSGVLRVTRGGGDGGEVDEKELLYFVGGDGGVRVFERGA